MLTHADLQAIGLTLQVAALTTLILLLLGTPLAWWLARTPSWIKKPLAALDAPRKADILPYLERLQTGLRLPVIYVTHAIDEVARLADHLVLLDAGRVTAQGTTAELLTRMDLPLATPCGCAWPFWVDIATN